MNKNNKLTCLPQADQRHILHLCQDHTYDEVLEILLKPRPEGGLQLRTSRSALSRFHHRSNPTNHDLEVFSQLAKTIHHRQSPERQTMLSAMLTLVEGQIFSNLINGHNVESLFPHFRVMNTLNRTLIKSGPFQPPVTGEAESIEAADLPDFERIPEAPAETLAGDAASGYRPANLPPPASCPATAALSRVEFPTISHLQPCANP